MALTAVCINRHLTLKTVNGDITDLKTSFVDSLVDLSASIDTNNATGTLTIRRMNAGQITTCEAQGTDEEIEAIHDKLLECIRNPIGNFADWGHPDLPPPPEE